MDTVEERETLANDVNLHVSSVIQENSDILNNHTIRKYPNGLMNSEDIVNASTDVLIDLMLDFSGDLNKLSSVQNNNRIMIKDELKERFLSEPQQVKEREKSY